jgi:predicted small lipoprotein YifL
MPSPRLLLTLLGLLVSGSPLLRGAPTGELHPGLNYVTLAELAQAEPNAAWVLDARQAAAVPAPPAAATETLRHPTHPLLVLLDANSPAWLRDLLAEPSPRRLTLAAAGTAGPVDIPVATTAEADAAAHQTLVEQRDFDAALGRGTAKRRRDQATLNGRGSPPTLAPVAPGSDALAPDHESSAPPPDLVLQQAVQIHAGLKALGRW